MTEMMETKMRKITAVIMDNNKYMHPRELTCLQSTDCTPSRLVLELSPRYLCSTIHRMVQLHKTKEHAFESR